jgi:2-aminoadipate transaminase
MDTGALEGALRAGPKFIYALPNFQNPAGVTLAMARRRRLVELADRYGVPIVEDDPYGQLRFEGRHLPPVVVIDAAGHGALHNGFAYSGNVIYLSTFSKILAPGLRLAWMVIPEKLYDMVLFCKQPSDLHSSMSVQMAVHELCRDGFADRHVEKVKAVYRERRDAMLEALEAHFPRSVHWTRPEGGLFVWAELPPSINARELLVESVLQKVAFVPGQSFHADGSGRNTMRLNFSNVPPDQLREGIRRLGHAIQRRMARSEPDDHRVSI